jgi:hypothetical protein
VVAEERVGDALKAIETYVAHAQSEPGKAAV